MAGHPILIVTASDIGGILRNKAINTTNIDIWLDSVDKSKSRLEEYNVTDQRKKTMSHIRGKDTLIEVKLRKELWNRGFSFRKNYEDFPGSPDSCLTKYRIAIFYDSEFFHGKDWGVLRPKVEKGNNGTYWVKIIQENMIRNDEVDKKLNFLGWTVIYFWGKDILKNTDECIKVIEETIFDIKLGEIEE